MGGADYALGGCDPGRVSRMLGSRVNLALFLDARGRARGPIVCVSDETMLTNAAASYLVGGDDHEDLWEWAQRALIAHDDALQVLQLGDRAFDARCKALSPDADTRAALIRLSAKRRPLPTIARSVELTRVVVEYAIGSE